MKQTGDDKRMDDDDSWEGGFTFLRKNIHKKIDLLKEEMSMTQNQQTAKLRDLIRLANGKLENSTELLFRN